jgi:bis(5'-nucleosyl)-tetraphosphatase (symmetrical)
VIDLEEKALAGPEGFRPWFESRHPSLYDWTICFGHWAMLDGVFKPGLYGLDTGCVWGRALTAVRLEDGTIFRQAAL